MSNGTVIDQIIIEGVREDNQKFRPSDWAERISDMLATFGSDHKLCHSEFVHPCIIDGDQCLVVNRKLGETHPEAYKFILHFVQQNKLRVQKDRRVTQRGNGVEGHAQLQETTLSLDAGKNLLLAPG